MTQVRVWYTVAENHEDTVEVEDDYGEREIADALYKQHPFADDLHIEDWEEVKHGR